MHVRLSKLTKLPQNGIIYFDLHENLGLAYLVETADDIVLHFNGIPVRSWPFQKEFKIRGMNWFSSNTVILHLGINSAMVVSPSMYKYMQLGSFDRLLLSSNYIFVSYGEEAFFSAENDDLELNILSVFARDGTFHFGLFPLIKNERDTYLVDVEAGYTSGDMMIFTGWEKPALWILNAASRTYRKIFVLFDLVGIHVLSGDDKKAYGIFDNRYLMRHSPELVPFELAVFDLIAETAIKQDFAPIERELLASGFKMEALKFQPSSTGKIIVSDGEKAAFLEFSDDV